MKKNFSRRLEHYETIINGIKRINEIPIALNSKLEGYVHKLNTELRKKPIDEDEVYMICYAVEEVYKEITEQGHRIPQVAFICEDARELAGTIKNDEGFVE